MRPRTIIVFARAARFGSVKTRLAREIGPLAALAFHRRTMAATLDAAAGVRGARTVLWVTPDGAARRDRSLPPCLPRFPQGPGDLGRRMARALRHHNDSDTVLIGCDIPAMTTAHLEQAFRLLESHSAVFGPAVDGGFWLVGFRRGRVPTRLFRRVRWSGPHALADSLAGLPAETKLGFAQTLNDVDDLGDYRRVQG